jgi:anthranilate synthase component 2
MERGAETQVVRNDALGVDELLALQPDRIVLSPGPGRPENPLDFGVCGPLLARAVRGEMRIPLLGVCLGHQGLVHALGGRVVHAPRPMHGKVTALRNLGGRLLQQLPSTFDVMRYHSLLAERVSLPNCLTVTAQTDDDDALVMAVEHVTLPLFGVQFHPESVGTPLGGQLMSRFLSVEFA